MSVLLPGHQKENGMASLEEAPGLMPAVDCSTESTSNPASLTTHTTDTTDASAGARAIPFAPKNGGSSKDTSYKNAKKLAFETCRDEVWPHIKFVTCEEDRALNSDMANIAFDHIWTPNKAAFWRQHKDVFSRTLQQRRATSAFAMKMQFISEWKV